MKIPKKIKVGALTFIVEIVNQIDPNRNSYEDPTGETTHTDLTMKIKKGKQEAMEHTFLHELFHTLHHGINDERLVESLANRLHSFIKDNPGVFE